MPPSIYLDDCSDENLLIARLRQAGYDVISPREAGTVGINDPDHMEYASRHGYAVLTHNPQDFVELHHHWQTQGLRHNGVLLVYRDNDPAKDMTAGETVRALENLLASGLSVANSVHTLNHWR